MLTMNIVMLVRDRPRLTRQCFTSLVANTDIPWNLTIVDDSSQPETRELLKFYARRDNVALLRNENSKCITGQARNLGIYWAQKYWGQGGWLYLSDNDVYFKPKWASTITEAMNATKRRRSISSPILLVGGQQHPYHGTNSSIKVAGYELHEVDAVAGYSQLMCWSTWYEFGPLDAHGVGVGMSEDFAFCQKIKAAGGSVAYIHPEVIYDCGITTFNGKPAVGAEAKPRVEGVIYE